jgi:hypothetical protein
LLTGLCCASCGGSERSPVDATAEASQRLQGNWRLLSFKPSLALEEPIKGLLDAQMSALTLAFSNGEFTATGPGVNTSGRYQIDSAKGDLLSGRVFDRAGAGYGISGEFVGSQFRFTSQDSPWSGQGVLERAQ